jgi:exopolyphosphatase/guanosine-5'-triphosphate,3'-diphosphate pyrophosphatase
VVESGLSAAEGSLLGAIDLGSNSFHLIIARVEHGEIRPIHTLGERVQLGAGFERGRLAEDAMARGLDCLTRFAQLLESVEITGIRIVGTHALRQAKNRREFTDAAEAVLGAPIDVVYGREEARLIYLGVAHTLADDESSRLVVDIGGGSTEFIVGQRFEPQRLVSLQLGCVSYSQQFFPEGGITAKNFRQAYEHALLEVSHIRKHYQSQYWNEAVGASGTLQAIELLIQHAGWLESGIDRKSLEKLKKRLLKFQHADDIDLEGLSDKRKHVIASGVAITMAIFDGLKIETMRTSKGALREGVIYDLVGRLTHEDVRERSIAAMLSRYGSDEGAAQSVSDRVTWLASSVARTWNLKDQHIELAAWAGRCHEIGVAISQKHHHHHSAYLIQNTDMPGFSQDEQEIMAVMLRGQQGKLPLDLLKNLPKKFHDSFTRLTALLRLAILFKWSESIESIDDISVAADKKRLIIYVPAGWRKTHPLTLWEIKKSKTIMSKLGVSVIVRNQR